jgi:hypothetical protein
MAQNFAFVDPGDLSREQVAQVRRRRVEQEFSWRGVAEAATEAWGSDFGGNQLFGEELCRAAAEALGKDPFAAPWT